MGIGWIIFLLILISWIALLYILNRFGVLEKFNMSIYFIFLMWRTKKGRRTIDRLARFRRFWVAFANLSLILGVVAMALMFSIVVLSTITQLQVKTDPMPLNQILVIPGVNPIIPLWYGILALAIAIIVHEFSHGILTRVADLKIKSLGLLFAVIPMGAFVEPDEEQLLATRRRNRMRVFAAGPGSNIIFGLLCAMVFSWIFMANVVPIEDGAVVVQVMKDPQCPAYEAGVRPLMEIVEIDGVRIENQDDLYDFDRFDPGDTIPDMVVRDGDERIHLENLTAGVVVLSVTEDLPAQRSGIEPGMIIQSVDGNVIRASRNLSDVLANTDPGQEVNISVLERNASSEKYEPRSIGLVELDDVRDYYPGEDRKGFLGIQSSYLGVVYESAGQVFEGLAHPVTGADSKEERRVNVANYILIYPVEHQILPMSSPFTDIYEIEDSSIMSHLPVSVFWFLANIFYYLFWLNILLGTFNLLPAVPLDGGFLFRDGLHALLIRIRPDYNSEKREQSVKVITGLLALSILMMLLISIFYPYT